MIRRVPAAGWRLHRLLATSVAVLLGLTALPQPAGAAAAPGDADGDGLEDSLRRSWYYTEVIVFQRPAVLDHLAEEALVAPPRPLPRNLRAFASERPLSEQYPLYPQTHAYLAFPYLDQSLLAPWRTGAAGQADPGLDTRGPVSEPESAVAGIDAGRATPGMPPPAIRPRLEPDPLLDFLAALADFEAELAAQSYRWLAPGTFTLTGMANRLSRSSGYRVLLHGRWLQPVPARDAPEALLIEAGTPIGGAPPLKGSFDVTLGRYLHFNAHLYYTEPLLDRAPLDHPLPPPALDVAPAAGLDAADFAASGYMQLHQSRRLRSDEVHYLDHPKLGIIVKIDAAEPPEALRAAFEALEKSQE